MLYRIIELKQQGEGGGGNRLGGVDPPLHIIADEGAIAMTNNEKRFLEMVHDPELRPILLERLRRIGLLSVFQEIENETTPTT